MVNIKDEGNELVFSVRNGSYQRSDRVNIHISPEAADVLRKLQEETGLTQQVLASELILWATKHSVVEKEGKA